MKMNKQSRAYSFFCCLPKLITGQDCVLLFICFAFFLDVDLESLSRIDSMMRSIESYINCEAVLRSAPSQYSVVNIIFMTDHKILIGLQSAGSDGNNICSMQFFLFSNGIFWSKSWFETKTRVKLALGMNAGEWCNVMSKD